MSTLHVVRSTNVNELLDEFGEILWTEFGETVVDAATDAQLKEAYSLSSDELLKVGFVAGVRMAMVKSLSGSVTVGVLHGTRKGQASKEDGSTASALRTPVRSLSGRALRWLRRCIWGR